MTFKKYWEEEFHPTFGRYMAWVLFLVGAENIAKAACVCNRLFKASAKPVLEDYTKSKGHLYESFGKKSRIFGDDKYTLQEGYKYLKNIRNRDAHSYRKGVRSADFPRVEQTFVPALNIVVKAMKCRGHQLP